MPSLQEQARALGDPTRHRIFRDVADAESPVTVAELVDRHGLNHNAIRQHLAKLVAAGLLVEATAPPSGPGRPRLLFRPAPDIDSRWGVTGPYERLSRMLAEVIRSGRSPREVGRDAGRRRAGAGTVPADAVARVHDAMAHDGFDPETRATPDGAEVVLRRCPFESTAAADPGTVCALHLGMVEGVVGDADAVGRIELVARDPRVGPCSVLLERAGPADPPIARG